MVDIKTIYPVSFSIDDKTFGLKVSDPTKEQKKEMETFLSQNADQYKELDSLNADLKFKKQEYEVNVSIIKDASIKDKTVVWFEQKKLIKEIRDLTSKIKFTKEDLESIDNTIEKMFEQRLKLTISGDMKEAFFEEVNKKAIPYSSIVEIISQKIAKEKEKK